MTENNGSPQTPQSQPRSPRPPSPAPGGRGRRRPRRPLATVALAVLAALGVFEAARTVTDPPGRQTGTAAGKGGPAAGTGMNVLLVGVDTRATITPRQKTDYHLGGRACGCTDTMMLVHIAQNRRRVSVVSLPRDSLAVIPAYTDSRGRTHRSRSAKLNAAYAEGGADLSMRTVERMTGVRIDRFLPVDFARFMRTVDEVGGLDVCTDRPLKDPSTALDLPVGTTHLSGGQSLQYARSRHVDQLADFGRIQRQQKLIVSFVKEIASGGSLRSPARMAVLASVLLPDVPEERAFTTKDALILSWQLRNIGLDSLEFSTVPVKGYVTVKGVGSTIAWDPAKSAAVFRAVRLDRPLTTAGAAAPDHPERPGAAPQGFVPVKGSRLACPN